MIQLSVIDNIKLLRCDYDFDSLFIYFVKKRDTKIFSKTNLLDV